MRRARGERRRLVKGRGSEKELGGQPIPRGFDLYIGFEVRA